MIDLALGNTPVITAEKEEPCAVLELFPRTPGIFEGIENRETLESLSSLEYLAVKTKPGQYVGKAADGYKMCAIVILHHTDPEVFARDLQTVNDKIFVTTTS
jgi:hypothetical protein